MFGHRASTPERAGVWEVHRLYVEPHTALCPTPARTSSMRLNAVRTSGGSMHYKTWKQQLRYNDSRPGLAWAGRGEDGDGDGVRQGCGKGPMIQEGCTTLDTTRHGTTHHARNTAPHITVHRTGNRAGVHRARLTRYPRLAAPCRTRQSRRSLRATRLY